MQRLNPWATSTNTMINLSRWTGRSFGILALHAIRAHYSAYATDTEKAQVKLQARDIRQHDLTFHAAHSWTNNLPPDMGPGCFKLSTVAFSGSRAHHVDIL